MVGLVAVTAVLALFAAGATPPPTYLFDDEFSGNGVPDTSKWWRSNSCGANPVLDNCWNANNAYMNGKGRLVLRMTPGTMGRPYDGARIQTLATDWPPGPILASVSPPVHVEAAIKFGPGAGLWQEFWFTRADQTGPNDLELDVQESRGAVPLEDTCHVHVGGVETWGATIKAGADLSGAMHVYWMNYYADHVVFGVDGLTCGTTTLTFAPAEVIRFQFDVGKRGTWGGRGGPPPAAAFPAHMLVDYVRVSAIP